jgi:hypothetical protein
MRHPTFSNTPSLASEIGSLAGLYRTVFWMIGRRVQYGRIWPREADMGPEDSLYVPAPVVPFEAQHARPVEAAARD